MRLAIIEDDRTAELLMNFKPNDKQTAYALRTVPVSSLGQSRLLEHIFRHDQSGCPGRNIESGFLAQRKESLRSQQPPAGITLHMAPDGIAIRGDQLPRIFQDCSRCRYGIATGQKRRRGFGERAQRPLAEIAV